MKMPRFKVGIGYDIHQLAENRDLIIGGVKIPYEKGLAGHSDADVLVHAIIDAMLGAAGLPDIGTLFPDDKKEFEGISSLVLLERVLKSVNSKGFVINNLDSNIIAQKPKMMSFIPQMKEVLAKTLELPVDA